MKRLLSCGLLAVLAACSDAVTGPAADRIAPPAASSFARRASTPIAGRYIVVFKSTVQDVGTEASAMERRHGAKIRHLFKSALRGVTLDLADAEVASLRAEPTVAYVEQDQTIGITAVNVDAPLVNAASGQCLATQNGGTAAATPAAMAPCTGAVSQQLSLPAVGTPGPILFFSGTTCFDDLQVGGNVGDVVGIYPCHGGANQRWTLSAAGEVTMNGLCVTPTGSNVTLQSCNGGAAQRWTTSAGTPPPTRVDAPLVNGASGQCLATQNGSSAAATTATVAPCTGSPSQVLSLPSAGTAGAILFFNGTTCFDDLQVSGSVGDILGIYPCHGGANQSWTRTTTGQVTMKGLCVTQTGTTITLQTCTGSAAQQWTTTAPTQPPPSTRVSAPLVNAASGQCLATQNGGTAAATLAAMAPCTGATSQLLSIAPVGTAGPILFFSGTTCFDDLQVNGNVGDVLGIYPCHGGANQNWTLSVTGEVTMKGLCVTPTGSTVTLQTCIGSSAQRWTTAAQTSPTLPTLTQAGATWGLDRIDQRALPLSGSYTYQGDGSGVTAYIVDTGINFTHSEFGSRATAGVDLITSGGGAVDCNGHGTHVAGTVGGTTYGVAKNVRLVAVRVIDCNGNGTTSSVIAGIDWITANRVLPAVANVSLGGGFSQALNDAVERSIAAGVVFAVSAGNSTADACTASPASAPNAITVGATDNTDTFASFSNYGSCVKLGAPGVSIVSAWIGGATNIVTASGTSMASPHVAGAAAVYLQRNPSATPSQVRAALVGGATANALRGIAGGTPNLLLYSPSGG